MWELVISITAFMIGGFGLTSKLEPSAQPNNQFELPMARVSGGVAPEPVQITPYSEFKFRNIVHQAYDYSCGSAALVTVINNYLGIKVTEQQAMEGMLEHGERDKIVARRGFSLLDMKRYVASLGAEGAGFRAELSELIKLDQPAIVPIDYAGFKHFVVFRGVRGDKVFIADPAMGHIVFSLDKFAELWDRNTLFILSPSKSKPTTLSDLALTDRELGVFDTDVLRDNVVFRSADRTAALQQAIQAQMGAFSLRK